GALAAPTFAKVQKAVTSTGKAGQTAWAQLDPAQRGIAKSVQSLEQTFESAERAVEPVLASLTGFAADTLRSVLPSLQVLGRAGGQALGALLTPLGKFLGSAEFAQLARQLGALAVQAAQVLGPSLASLAQIM